MKERDDEIDDLKFQVEALKARPVTFDGATSAMSASVKSKEVWLDRSKPGPQMASLGTSAVDLGGTATFMPAAPRIVVRKDPRTAELEKEIKKLRETNKLLQGKLIEDGA